MGGIGLVSSEFLNAGFNQSVQDEIVEARGIGPELSVHGNLMPFMLEVSYFSSTFYVDSDHPIFDGHDNGGQGIRHRGMAGSISLSVLPTSRYIFPYVGVGYHLSHLGTGDEFATPDDVTYDNPLNSIVNVSTPIVQAGLHINFSRKLAFMAEYTRGTSSTRGMNMLSARLIYRGQGR